MAMRDGRSPGTEGGWAVIDAGVRSAGRALGDALVSAYAIGSLAHGGFSAASSDVDLALLTSDMADGDMPVEQISREVERELPGPLSERLSVFHVSWSRFASPPPAARFPSIDRLDLMRSGILVLGEDLRGRFGIEPAPDEVPEQAVSAALARHDPARLRAEIATLTPTTIDGRTASKLILWPVRPLHTADTVEAAGNDDAVAHYREGTPAPRHLPLVEAALSWRGRDGIPEPEPAPAALRSEAIPLYAEIYGRLTRNGDLPHTEAIAARAASFADAARY
jgi:predicted nucleotidyltransferase